MPLDDRCHAGAARCSAKNFTNNAGKILMFQRGICTVDDLLHACRKLSETRPGLRRSCYIGLYQAAASVDDNLGRRLQEAILEQFAVANGAFKRTSRRRFDEFDELTLQILRHLPALRQRCVVHDMAISDGRTACDLFAKLLTAFGEPLEFYGTDLCLKVMALREPRARTTVVIDEYENVLQLLFPPFVLPLRGLSHREKWLYYPMNSALRMMVMGTAAKRVLRLYRSGSNALEQREIALTCPELKELVAHNTNFHIETYSMFEQAPRQYSVVRAMNIFNRTYFTDCEIRIGVGNVFRSLEEGGVFVTGSNSDAGSQVNGAIYQKLNGGFTSICSSGAGSQIDHIVNRAGSRDGSSCNAALSS